jgi:hypothetical protein
MRLGDWTRQTRWAHAPTPAPPGVSPGGAYVRELIWAICPACDLQVHGSLAVARGEGLRCPECGGALSPPLSGGDAGAAARIAADEARLAGLLRQESGRE